MKTQKLGCDYFGCDFGAHYLDSTCIDGYLWDMDSGGCDDDYKPYYDVGGDIPCPQCNAKEYVKSYVSDDLMNAGYESLTQPLTVKQIKNILSNWPANRRRMGIRFWREGRREAVNEAMRQDF